MDYFSIIKDSDVFENPGEEPKEYKVRPTVKGVVLDNQGRVALVSGPPYGYALLPGGGVEEDETHEQAFVRECKEEIGCNVVIVYKLGSALQFRAKLEQQYEVDFFVAEVIGEKGLPTSIQKNEQSLKVFWCSKEEVLKVLENNFSFLTDEMYAPHFNCKAQLVAFKRYLEIKR